MVQPSEIQAAVRADAEDARQLVRQLFDYAELPYHEEQSSAAMAKLLEQAGFEVEYPFFQEKLGYGTAYRATLKNGEGPKVAFLAEYDALPIIGHGCGHNLHGPLSVLAGLAMARLKDRFSGTVQVIGTPAEEENGAKIPMASDGVFDDLDLAVMMHSWSGGTSCPDMDVLSLRCYVAEFYGREAHAVAGPWAGASALAAARKFLDLVDARRESFTRDVRFNAVLLEGGSFPNTIPGYAKIRLEFRTDSRGKLAEMDRIVRRCAEGAAMAMDCTVTFTPGLLDFDDMVRVDALETETARLLAENGETVGEILPASGSSDLGNVSYRCPSIQPLISITDEALALHTEKLRDATLLPAAHRAMKRGACTLAGLALRVLNDEAFRAAVRSDFQRALKEKG